MLSSRRALKGAVVIAAGTVLEAVRNRLLLVMLFFAIVLVAMSIVAASVSILERSRLIVDVGLAAASAIGSIIAIALTVTSFASELRRRTAYTVLVRPIPRWAFVFGKYLGVVVTMELVVTCMVVATAGTVWLYGEPAPAALWSSLWLAYFEMAIVCAIAMLFSSASSPVLAAMFSAGLVLAGSLTADIERLSYTAEAAGNVVAGRLLMLAHYVLPDLQMLSVRSQAANQLEVPAGFVGWGMLYATCYATMALVAAMWIFKRRRTI